MKTIVSPSNTIIDRLDKGNTAGGTNVRLKLANSKSGKLSKFKNQNNNHATKKPNFLIFKAIENFNHLKQTFIKVPIFWHFDPEHHIWIEINVSSYIIIGVLSQLTLNQLILLYLISFMSDFA